jgi:hypothetical protein
MAPDLRRITAALEHAQSVRGTARGLAPGDPERIAMLEDAAGRLREARDPLTPHVRKGGYTGRRVSHEPVRATCREVAAEIKRLRSMLDPRPGTPRPAAARLSVQAMDGHVGRARQQLHNLQAEHDAMRRGLRHGSFISVKGGGSFPSTRELREEAGSLLEQLTDARQTLNTAFGRYSRRPRSTYKAQDDYDRIAEQVADLREDFDSVAATLRASATKMKPDPLPRPTWSRPNVERALADFQETHGRLPKARELRAEHRLPPYTVLRRMFGPSPLAALASRRQEHP